MATTKDDDAKEGRRQRRRWSFDLNHNDTDELVFISSTSDQQQSQQPSPSPATKYPAPYGMKAIRAVEKQLDASSSFSNNTSTTSTTTSSTTTNPAKALIAKKKSRAMQLAVSPGKQIAMNAFMMYMSGKALNIFSISVTSMAVLTPLKSIVSISTAFQQFEDPPSSSTTTTKTKKPGESVELQIPKLIFLALNLVWLGIGLYKMSSMRLLPTTSADWMGRVVWKETLEGSAVPPPWV